MKIWQQVILKLHVNTLRILSESETPPFPVEENASTREELRLKYRYLDLRRPSSTEKS